MGRTGIWTWLLHINPSLKHQLKPKVGFVHWRIELCAEQVGMLPISTSILQVVKAFIVLNPEFLSHDQEQLIKELQHHVKSVTAPYKYPRKVSQASWAPTGCLTSQGAAMGWGWGWGWSGHQKVLFLWESLPCTRNTKWTHGCTVTKIERLAKYPKSTF
jgi:hypothetical protein